MTVNIKVRTKRKKRNPFLDDEAESDGDGENEIDEDSDADLDGFIDDSVNESETNFDLRKQVEIELNREALKKFIVSQETSDLEEMGLSFVYSLPSDLVN